MALKIFNLFQPMAVIHQGYGSTYWLALRQRLRNKMDLEQLPLFATFKLYRFIPSQPGDLVKIHLVAEVAGLLF